MAHIAGEQRKTQKPMVLSQNERTQDLEQVTRLKASPKSRLKACKGETRCASFSTKICPTSVGYFCALQLCCSWLCDSTSVSWLNGGGQIGHSSLSSVVHTWLLLWELLHLDRFPIGIGRYLAVWTRYWVTLHVVILEHQN